VVTIRCLPVLVSGLFDRFYETWRGTYAVQLSLCDLMSAT